MSKSRAVKFALGFSLALPFSFLSSSHAATFNWTFICGNDWGCNGSGTLETVGPLTPTLISLFSGTFGSESDVALLPVSTWGNDNMLTDISSPALNADGLAFSTANYWFRIGFDGGDFVVYRALVGTTGAGNGSGGVFSVVAAPDSVVPIPAALPLFAAGLSAMGFMGWRRKRKTRIAA